MLLPPDPVTTTADLLRARMPGTTVGTVVPADLADRVPFVHVAQAGGAITNPSARGGAVVESARIAVTAWARGDLADARTLARAAVGHLLTVRAHPVPGGVVVRVRVDAAPAYVPDAFAPDGVHRFAATITIIIH